MKRKFHLNNIEIILPSRKYIKISELTIKLKHKMSEQDFNQEMDGLLHQYLPTYPGPKNDSTYDSESLYEESYKSGSDNDTVIEESYDELNDESTDDVVSIPETEGSEQSIVRTPSYEVNDKYDRIAKELSSMDRYVKGEEMEIKIKDQLEEYGFITTKTQSTFNKRILGDNGVDHFTQINIDGKMIRLVVQSKNWANELTSNVVRDLQGVLATQYPGWIGLLVINGGGINIRAKNLAENSPTTILIYNFNQLKSLKRDLKRLIGKDKIQTGQHQIEEFEDVEITERSNRRTTTIRAKRYTRRYRTY